MSDETSQDDGLNISIFDPNRVRQPLEGRKADYSDCRHLNVILDEQARSVTCRKCGKQIDAFWYLMLLAREWSARAYRDEAAKKAAAELDQHHRNAQARGHYFQKPSSGAALRAWNVFAEYYGTERFSIYHTGGMWYSQETNGTRLSEDYVAMLLSSGEHFVDRAMPSEATT